MYRLELHHFPYIPNIKIFNIDKKATARFILSLKKELFLANTFKG